MELSEALLLATKIATGNYTRNELDQFYRFVNAANPEELGQVLETYKESLDQHDSFALHVGSDFMERLRSLNPQTSQNKDSEIPVVEIKPKPSWIKRASVAAAVIAVLCGSYFYLHIKSQKQDALAKISLPSDIVAPQTNKASLTLANGQTILLDSAANGTLANQGNVQILKIGDGQIAYKGKALEETYNILTNPKGSKTLSMKLADGTSVWLNAESSLKYPVAFLGNSRNVEITGEAYFEVTHNPDMPFTVRKLHDDAQIQVLGTHFNVNAYDDENAIKVTLLEGSVKVNKGKNKSILKPGQQARISKEEIKVIDDVDVEEVMAWKNGKFQFGDAADIQTIMRQLSRWYDVDVTYQGNVSGSIGGSISRDVNASQVFKMLQTTGVVKFKIDGRRVTVMPVSP